MRHALLLATLVACGGSGTNATPDASAPDTPAPDGPAGCARSPAPADRARFVVVSRPYDSAGMPANTFEVLELSQSGALTRPSPARTFTLGRAVTGTIAFTPDGENGIAALEDGKLGVFHLDASGAVTVVDAGFAGSFYASRVAIDPRGDRAIVLDGNTRENGGGLYAVTIGCDGALTDHGMLAAAKLPGGVGFAGDRALVAASDLLDSPPTGDDVHLVQLGDPPARIAGADAFGDDEAIVGGTALTFDGGKFLIGDTSQFSSVPNRVAIVAINGSALKPLGTVMVEDPEAIVASPFGNVAVVASAFGDALFVLDEDTGAWRVRGQVTYKGGKPQLPGDMTAIDRGALRGRVLVSENVSVRQLAFHEDGSVEDVGSLAFGDGLESISGAIGVTP